LGNRASTACPAFSVTRRDVAAVVSMVMNAVRCTLRAV